MTTARDTMKAQVKSAIAAVVDCADTMESQAASLRETLPTVSIPEDLRSTIMECITGLRDTSGRVTFEMALLQTELAAGPAVAEVAAVVKSLSRMNAAMMAAVAALTDEVDRLEGAAEADEAHETAFLLVIEAIGVQLQALETAKAATELLGGATVGSAPSGSVR